MSAGGADLRPGATTWWTVRHTLPAGTELELLGRDSNFPGWVYAGTLDGAYTGWTQTENLEIYRELSALPIVTPLPTLTPASATPTTPDGPCEGGPLWLDAWPTSATCTSSGWTATIFVEGHGGNCQYTYYWEGVFQGGPTSGSMTFDIHSAGFGASVVGKASVS